MTYIQTNEIVSDVKVLSDDELNEVAAAGVAGIVAGVLSHVVGNFYHGSTYSIPSREYLAAVSIAQWFSQHR